jgi:hypothetical protein
MNFSTTFGSLDPDSRMQELAMRDHEGSSTRFVQSGLVAAICRVNWSAAAYAQPNTYLHVLNCILFAVPAPMRNGRREC